VIHRQMQVVIVMVSLLQKLVKDVTLGARV
jgi:hypothetical protein